MKKVIYSIAIATTIVLSSCGSDTKTEENNHKGHDHSEVSSPKYACPMKCEADKTYQEKGECPKCHMDLEELK